MKALVLAGLMLASFQAQAQDFRTADNVDYNIVLNDLSDRDFKTCVAKITELAGGPENIYQVLTIVGIVSANLTTHAADQIAQLSCVMAVEEDQMVYPNPRVGREN